MPTDTPHVGDIGTVIYLPTYTADGSPLGDTLDAFPTRIVRLRRPGLAVLLEITEVAITVDSADGVKKLTLETGSSPAAALTGTGGFALLPEHVGTWLAEIHLAHATGEWTMDAFPLFTLLPNLA